MILCHKCSGTFDNVPGLNFCQCMSGYPRGFEKEVDMAMAKEIQFKRELDWLQLMLDQGRPNIPPITIERLLRVRPT